MGSIIKRFGKMIKTAINKKLLAQAFIGIALILSGVVFRPVIFVAAAFCVFVILLQKDDTDVACLMFIWLSFSSIFHYSVTTPTIYTLLEIVFIVRFIARKRKIDASIFLFLTLLSAYIIIGGIPKYADVVKTIMLPLIFYILVQSTNYNALERIGKYYVLGVVSSSVIALFNEIIPNMNTFIQYKEVHVGKNYSGFITEDRFSGMWGDPNYFSVHLILAILILAYLFSKAEISVPTFYVGYIMLVIFGGMTGSKSFLLALVFATLFVIIVIWRGSNRFHVVFFVLMIALALFLMISGYIDVFSRVMARITGKSGSKQDFSTGRIDRWLFYINYFVEEPFTLLIGEGLRSGFSGVIPHNAYIDFLDLLVIVGSTLFFVPIGYSIYIWGGKKIGTIVPLIFLLVMYFSLSMIYSIDFIFELFLCIGFFVLAPEDNTVKAE